VGSVSFHVRTAGGQVLARDLLLPGGRADIRERSTTVAMHMLLRLLEGRGEDLL
jgi:nicotinamide-nucleotide amidase